VTSAFGPWRVFNFTALGDAAVNTELGDGCRRRGVAKLTGRGVESEAA
jgi:hypothetical protein